MASLATAQDQELLIFINKQIRHFDLGLKKWISPPITLHFNRSNEVSIFDSIGDSIESYFPIAQMHFELFLWSFGHIIRLILIPY